jgi:hypothetical protein
MVLKSIEALRSGLHDALSWGEDVAERLALAEVDAVIHTRVRGILIPSLVVAVLFAAVELAAAMIGDAETLRVAVTSIVLAAGVYGVWSVAAGMIEIMPIGAVWLSTGVTPHKLARLFLYQLILSRLQEAFTNAEGRSSTAGRIARYALKFSGRPSSWEGLAFRLADQIAPRMVRHAALQIVMVLIPVLAAWAYYRFQIFPEIIRSQTGLGIWSAFLYPGAALIDLIAGTSLRTGLIG